MLPSTWVKIKPHLECKVGLPDENVGADLRVGPKGFETLLIKAKKSQADDNKGRYGREWVKGSLKKEWTGFFL